MTEQSSPEAVAKCKNDPPLQNDNREGDRILSQREPIRDPDNNSEMKETSRRLSYLGRLGRIQFLSQSTVTL